MMKTKPFVPTKYLEQTEIDALLRHAEKQLNDSFRASTATYPASSYAKLTEGVRD